MDSPIERIKRISEREKAKREEAARRNRERWPDLAEGIDEFRDVFGYDQVRVRAVTPHGGPGGAGGD